MTAPELPASLRFVVVDGEAGRADRVIGARLPGLGRRALAELFAAGAVRIDGRAGKKGDRVAAGSEVVVTELPRDDRAAAPAPQPDLDLAVIYVDDSLVAVSKPGDQPSHPLRAGELGTLASALVARHPECAGAGEHAREAGLVHRLDTGTSGVLVAARDRAAWHRLRAEFGGGRVTKVYWALVSGAAGAAGAGASASAAGAGAAGPGRCDEPLVGRGKRVAVASWTDTRALPATTSWRPLGQFSGYTLLECTATTGRRHQVRVHLAHAGWPIVGDALYGGAALHGLAGHFLHARSVALSHPVTGERISLTAPLPADRQDVLDRLGGPSAPEDAPG